MDLEERLRKWITISNKFGDRADPFVWLEVQSLGHVDKHLIPLEEQAAEVFLRQAETTEIGEEPFLPTLVVSLGRLWVLGLYETLRTFRNLVGGNDSHRFVAFKEFFSRLAEIRIPLAKHELRGQNGSFYPPTHICNPSNGMIGWTAINPKKNIRIDVFRRDLADSFLKIASEMKMKDD